MPIYHFRLPDGQEHAWHKTPQALRKQYPDAVITGRVEFDEARNSVIKPYGGEQPATSDNAASESDETVAIDVTPVDGDAAAPEAEKSAARPKASRK